MKIYADENIERSIVEGLRRRKIEIASAGELGYLNKPDEFHQNISIGQCIRGVELIVNVLTDRDMENHIEFL